LKRIEVARARVRRHVWAQLPKLPASPVADSDLGGVVVLDVDATLVTSHSEKEHAAPTFKGGFGYHPLAVWCDNTQEMLAVVMRPGNAGSNTVADHIGVLTQAIAQVPSSYRKHMLIRADGAGSSHGLLDWLTEQGTKRGRTVEYSVGFATNGKVRDAIAKLPKKVWTAAVNADGDVREGGDVAEITTLLDLSGWPAGMRLIVRRERPHPGAQLSLFEEADGYRYQVVATNTGVGQLAFLEARHRAHAWVEDRIRNAKDSGLGLPLPGLRDQHRLGPARSDQRRPHRLAAAARADTRASRAFRTSGFMGSPGRWLIVSAAGWGRCRGVRGSGLAVVVVAGSGVGRGLGPVVVVGR